MYINKVDNQQILTPIDFLNNVFVRTRDKSANKICF